MKLFMIYIKMARYFHFISKAVKARLTTSIIKPVPYKLIKPGDVVNNLNINLHHNLMDCRTTNDLAVMYKPLVMKPKTKVIWHNLGPAWVPPKPLIDITASNYPLWHMYGNLPNGKWYP